MLRVFEYVQCAHVECVWLGICVTIVCVCVCTCVCVRTCVCAQLLHINLCCVCAHTPVELTLE